MPQDTKSPLKAPPLRVPGESIDAQLGEVEYDEIISPLALALFLALLAALEWYRYLSHQPPSPWTFTAAAIIGVAWAVWRARRGFVLVRRLRLGRSGERAVAQYLEWFRTKDFFVFHDIPTGDANIDHVLIGTRGLYVIETKTLSKPARGQCKIAVSDGRLLANGRPLDRDPVVQAKAQARWLHNFLAEADFKKFVQPIVVCSMSTTFAGSVN
jgi:hypothetical protein